MSRRRTLSSYDQLDDRPQTRRAKPTGHGTGEGLATISAGTPHAEPGEYPTLCWCGKLMGHYWQGVTEGAPHPRTGVTR